MTRKEAKETFYNIREGYNRIAYPKYLHADLDDLRKKYESLKEMEEFLREDFTYARLINSISQIIKRLDRKGTWVSTSERGMNKAIPPVIRRNDRETVSYEWESDKSGQLCCMTNGDWNARNYMVMDIVGHIFLLQQNGDRIPDEITPIFSNYESIKQRERELDTSNSAKPSSPLIITEDDLPAITKQKYYIKFEDHHFRKFTGLRLSSNDILKLLLDTSRVEFRITFPIRMIREKGRKMEDKWYSMNVFSRPFELGCIQDVRKDDIVQNRVYYVLFNTFLAEMFIHNLLTKNYDWISNKLYHLPQSSQIFYRHLLLHHNLQTQQFNLSTIVERMGFKDKNITNLIKNLEINTLNPLIKEGLVISYKQMKGLGGLKYEIILPEKGGQKEQHQQTDTTCISQGM
ncbi:MAG: hypothetical protein QUS13_07220 [Smithella sp.]|nr:hypothetical protein [Smithella sp.]